MMHKKDEKKKNRSTIRFSTQGCADINIITNIYQYLLCDFWWADTVCRLFYKKENILFCVSFFLCNIKVSYHLFNTGVVSKFKSLVCWKSCKEVKLSNNTQKANIRKKTNILIDMNFFSSKFAIFTNHKIVDIMFVIEHSFRYNFIAFCRCVKKMWRY